MSLLRELPWAQALIIATLTEPLHTNFGSGTRTNFIEYNPGPLNSPTVPAWALSLRRIRKSPHWKVFTSTTEGCQIAPCASA